MDLTITARPNSLILTFRMLTKSTDILVLRPVIEHGTEIVQLKVGPGSITRQVKDFAIHSNLLIATSKKLKESILEHSEATKRNSVPHLLLQIDDVEPAAFQVFYNWLYPTPMLDQRAKSSSTFTSDHLWALVYELGDRLGVLALQINAFHRFRACFVPSPLSSLIEEKRVIPSRGLLSLLFQTQAKPSTLQKWITDHLTWHIDNCSPGLIGIEDLLDKYPALRSILGQSILDSKYQRTH